MTRCPPEVEAVFDTYPVAARTCLMAARAVIFEAAETAGVGPLRETLKWGQPAYLPEAPRTGTTVRMGLDGGAPAVLFHCQTTLVVADAEKAQITDDALALITRAAEGSARDAQS
ncbi:MAG: hypothetical protein HKP29_11450, partial [Silicimonas sp.]|nr:hypothetical protein [Silicimonas sp.]